MKVIFDKEGEKPISHLVTYIHNDLEWSDMTPDVLITQDEVSRYIGEKLWKRIVSYYHDDYTIGGSSIMDLLIQEVQYAVAYGAYMRYAPTNDISHTSSGRKVLIDSDTEKSPYEWQTTRNDQMLTRKYYYFLDRVISFLESNKDEIIEWKETRQEFDSPLHFLRNAKEFDKYFPTTESGIFYYRTRSLQRQIEKDVLEPVLGKEFMKSLKLATDHSEHFDLIENVKYCVAYNVVVRALKTFSIETLPEGLYKNAKSHFQTMHAKEYAKSNEVDSYLRNIEVQAGNYLNKISEMVKKDDQIETHPVKGYEVYRNGMRLI